MTKPSEGKPTFSNLGISPKMLEQLEKLSFFHPTPIQEKSIPAGIEGKDVIGVAQTGTGKTLAFAIPMIQSLSNGEGKGLIILPTRELALQVEVAISKLGRFFGLKTAVLIGGASMHNQITALRRRPNVIVATPGRLIDHLEQRTIHLTDVKMLVLDEADRMLDMGFEPQIQKVLTTVPTDRQTMLFSATIPEKIVSITKKYMRSPIRVEVSPSGSTVKKIVQKGYMVRKQDKIRLLLQLLNANEGSMIVFTRTKHRAKKITQTLRRLGHGAAEIHSNRSLAQRRQALDGFRTCRYRVLVATDIAARGIDVTHIKFVINYDLPEQIEDYVHRIGRTGRAGREGTAISFIQPEQKFDLRRIERLIHMSLPMKDLPDLPEMKIEHDEPEDSRRRGGYRGQSGSGSRPYSGSRPSGSTHASHRSTSPKPYRRSETSSASTSTRRPGTSDRRVRETATTSGTRGITQKRSADSRGSRRPQKRHASQSTRRVRVSY